MEAVASGLAAGAGLDKPGVRVGMYSTNCREWMIAMQARAHSRGCPPQGCRAVIRLAAHAQLACHVAGLLCACSREDIADRSCM